MMLERSHSIEKVNLLKSGKNVYVIQLITVLLSILKMMQL